jgi:ATP-dependent Clp protease ATP-binding subunit ClpC
MFERYTESARRIIFFGRYEASQFGSPYIETEHILLGLLREDKALTSRILRGQATVESIRKQIEDATTIREKISVSVDLPLINECKRVLAYAAEEAQRLSHKHIGTEHLLLGLLREEKSFAAHLLNEQGVSISRVREQLAQESGAASEAAIEARQFGVLEDFSVYLTRLARLGRLLPLIGRENKLEEIMHILGRSSKNNVVLVGEPGVGKRTIVEGLAQRVADNMVPTFLQGKLLVAIDLPTVTTAALHGNGSKEFLSAVARELFRASANTIFFFDELHALLAAGPGGGAHEITMVLKPALLSGGVRCIASATPQEYRTAITKARWLERCFLAVYVEPATEAETIRTLEGIKDRFEKFHSVQYAEDALAAAVVYSNRCVKDRHLPDKAVDLIDDAGAYVKMKNEKVALPQEIVECGKRIKVIVQQMEDAIANHEFEKARFYSAEERKQREALLGLEQKYNIPQARISTVTVEHIEEVLARWTGMPVAAIREASSSPEMTEGKQKQDAPRREKKQRRKKSP